MFKPFLKITILVAILATFFIVGLQAEIKENPKTNNISASSNNALSAEAVRDIVERSISMQRPGTKVIDARPAGIDGFYQMNIDNGPELYANDQGTHFFIGDLFALEEDGIVNVSEEIRNNSRKAFINSASAGEYISFAPATKTKAVLNVFTDVSCGYCRKLHNEMNALNAFGIEVRYFAFPRAGVGSGDYKKMVSAWCSNNPHSAMNSLKAGQAIPEKLCDNNPVAKHYSNGQRLGIQGTPAIFMEDGQLIPGYRPAKEFARMLGLL